MKPCGKKRAFPDRISAHMALMKIAEGPRQGPVPERCYECRSCGKWHLTTQPKGRP